MIAVDEVVGRLMMASVNDWAAKAARRIIEEEPPLRDRRKQEERYAAIIATFAEPMLKLLNEARRSHSRGYNDEVCDYPPCPVSYDEEDTGYDERCTCGANEWNKKIDEALNGR